MNRIDFINTEIDNLDMHEALDAINSLIIKRKNAYVVTPNVDHIVQLNRDMELKKVYHDADLIFADGMPIIWISKILGTPLKAKISGSDLFPLLCKMAAKHNYSMFFLGAAEGVAEKAAKNLMQKCKGLNVIGVYSPPVGFDADIQEINNIINLINNKKPDILVVGLGAPKQEKFIYKYRKKLDVPISLGLGASLDFEAGNIRRAPTWMSNNGLEWFYRFVMEPRRLFKRYFIDDVKIIGITLKYILYKKVK